MTKSEVARRLVERMPEAPARTLARRLVTDYPELFPNVENARKSVLYVLGTGGTKNKRSVANKTSFRKARKAGWKPEFPPSSAEDWKPLELSVPGVVLSLSDLHVPYHDKKAIDAAVAHVKKKHRITHLVLNGDYGDFYRISRFQRNPLKRSLRDELEAQRDGLVWLAEKFPNARKFFKRGNHDERWNHWVWNHAPEMADCEHMQLGDVLKLANYGYEEVGDEPIMAGILPILHGHELGHGPASPVNPARGAFMRTLSTVLVGHHHQTSTHAQGNMWHKEKAAYSQGCLCNLSPEYARVNKWNHGFAVIEVAKDRSFEVLNYRIGTGGAVRAA